jgi:hypothetical protein
MALDMVSLNLKDKALKGLTVAMVALTGHLGGFLSGVNLPV